MLYATIAHSPVFGGQVASFATKAKAVAGVHDMGREEVVETISSVVFAHLYISGKTTSSLP